MSAMASQIVSLTIVYSAVYSGVDQRRHQRSESLAFERGIHRSPVNSPHKGAVTRKMFPFDDVIMWKTKSISSSPSAQMTLLHWRRMMTSSNENIFRVTGPLCGDFTGHRWIPLTKASDAEVDVFFGVRLNKLLSKQSRGGWFVTPSRSLWRHCNVWINDDSRQFMHQLKLRY